MGGVVSALHVVIRVAGTVVDDERIEPPHGSRVGFPQPWEKTISGAGKGAAKVEVAVDAIGDPAAKPLFTRLSSTHFVPGRTALLRIPLESRCIVYPATPRGREQDPGAAERPHVHGAGDVHHGRVPVLRRAGAAPRALCQQLADERARPVQAPQRRASRPAGRHGPGLLRAVTPGQVLAGRNGAARGPSHLDRHAHEEPEAGRIDHPDRRRSARDRHAPSPRRRSPSRTLRTKAGYCKLYGIRYQLDNEGIDYKQFLGKPLDITVTVTDPAGATATPTTHINIAPTLVNP